MQYLQSITNLRPWVEMSQQSVYIGITHLTQYSVHIGHTDLLLLTVGHMLQSYMNLVINLLSLFQYSYFKP